MSCIPGDTDTPSHQRYQLKTLKRDNATVDRIDDVITTAEKEYLLETYLHKNPMCRESRTTNGSASAETSSGRKSLSCFLPKGGGDSVISCLEKRFAKLSGIDVKQLERLQITKYEQGGKYNEHFDYFPNQPKGKPNRKTTLLVYLQECDERCGGNTDFPRLNLSHHGSAKSALFWNNMENGVPNTSTLHAGRPLQGGEAQCSKAQKVVLNVWGREKL